MCNLYKDYEIIQKVDPRLYEEITEGSVGCSPEDLDPVLEDVMEEEVENLEEATIDPDEIECPSVMEVSECVPLPLYCGLKVDPNMEKVRSCSPMMCSFIKHSAPS